MMPQPPGSRSSFRISQGFRTSSTRNMRKAPRSHQAVLGRNAAVTPNSNTLVNYYAARIRVRRCTDRVRCPHSYKKTNNQNCPERDGVIADGQQSVDRKCDRAGECRRRDRKRSCPETRADPLGEAARHARPRGSDDERWMAGSPGGLIIGRGRPSPTPDRLPSFPKAGTLPPRSPGSRSCQGSQVRRGS